MLVFLFGVLLTIASAARSPTHSDCYREGDIVLDSYNRCKYRTCERLISESDYGYPRFELKDKACAEGTGVPYFLLQQHLHGVYGGHRFIGSHLASTVCSDKHVKDCTARGHGIPYAGHFGYGPDGYSGYARPAKAAEEEKPLNT